MAGFLKKNPESQMENGLKDRFRKEKIIKTFIANTCSYGKRNLLPQLTILNYKTSSSFWRRVNPLRYLLSDGVKYGGYNIRYVYSGIY